MIEKFVVLPEGMTDIRHDPWDEIYEAYKLGTHVAAKIKRIKVIEGQGHTWELEFDNAPGVVGWVPDSQTGLPAGAPMSEYVGSMINVVISGISKKEGIVACSRQEVVSRVAKVLSNKLAEGEIIPAVVKIIRYEKVYADIGGGLMVKVQNVRASDGVTLEAQYSVDDIIKVEVVSIKKETGEIEVQIVNPWDSVAILRGDIVEGRVVGAWRDIYFVRIGPGIVGICNEMSVKMDIGDIEAFQVNRYDPIERVLRMELWNYRRAGKIRSAKARRKMRSPGNARYGANTKIISGVFPSEEPSSKVALSEGASSEEVS